MIKVHIGINSFDINYSWTKFFFCCSFKLIDKRVIYTRLLAPCERVEMHEIPINKIAKVGKIGSCWRFLLDDCEWNRKQIERKEHKKKQQQQGSAINDACAILSFWTILTIRISHVSAQTFTHALEWFIQLICCYIAVHDYGTCIALPKDDPMNNWRWNEREAKKKHSLHIVLITHNA